MTSWVREKLIRENAYRDFWLLVITALVAWALLGQQGQIEDIQQVQSDTAKLARQTARLARSIQAQRANSILTSCQDTNQRHDNTIGKLDELLAEIPAGPERDRAIANRAGTVLLIDALVPKQNCRRRVSEALTPAPQLVPDR